MQVGTFGQQPVEQSYHLPNRNFCLCQSELQYLEVIVGEDTEEAFEPPDHVAAGEVGPDLAEAQDRRVEGHSEDLAVGGLQIEPLAVEPFCHLIKDIVGTGWQYGDGFCPFKG